MWRKSKESDRKTHAIIRLLNRINTALSFFNAHKDEMIEGTEILWPEYLEYYYLMCKRQAMGEKSFYKELQNDPRSTDDYIFQNIIFWDRLPDFDEMEIVMYIDPAIKETNHLAATYKHYRQSHIPVLSCDADR